MPNDTLAGEVEEALREAHEFLRLGQSGDRALFRNLGNLKTLESRLARDIEERQTTYPESLTSQELREIEAKSQELNSDPRFIRALTEQKAYQQTFDHLRQINGGAYPRNVSPVLYAIPLILIGVAEWYVNYSTFAAIFVPVVAIFGTIVVGAIFAVASHIHGAFIKQLSEIIHPSVEYRNVLGRKIALLLASIFLIAAFVTVVSLRYVAISDQLGMDLDSSGVFGSPSYGLVWSRLGPTIVINVLIWGLGTLYSWAMHERVPQLREAYRGLLRVNRRMDRARAPFLAEQKRIKAKYDRDRDGNQVALKEYGTYRDRIRDTIDRINSAGSPKTTPLRSAP